MFNGGSGGALYTRCKSEFADRLFEILERQRQPEYEPTGLQEDVILAVGCGKYEIVLALHPNDVGKTALGCQMLRNMMWPVNEKWFAWWDGYSLYRDRKWPLKRFRITSEHTALNESGQIHAEIRKWWPIGEYEWSAGGKPYPSACTTTTGWIGDALSYHQDRTMFESIKLDVTWSDEPPPYNLIGAITSRFTERCLWIVTATPINCGAFLDAVDDLEERGTKVKRLTGTAFENSMTKGKTNHLKTRRGLRTDEEIASKVARCPPEEVGPRIYGEASNKSGKIYPMYDDTVHVLSVDQFDLVNGSLAKCNCYMGADPHRKYYPAWIWLAVTPDNRGIIYNEWPTVDTMSGRFYEEVREEILFTKSFDDQANIIKALDFEHHGAQILKRAADPRFCAENPTWLSSMADKGIGKWVTPPFEKIEEQRKSLQELLRYNQSMPVTVHNCPDLYVMSHCRNVRRALSRHHWADGKEKEAEDMKDFIDAIRYILAVLGGKLIWHPPETKKRAAFVPFRGLSDETRNMKPVDLG